MSTSKLEFVLPHPCGLSIRKGLGELSVKGVAGVETRDMRNGYVWYRLPDAEIGGQTIAMTLCFNKGSLELISVAVVDPDLYGASWSDWSAEKEQACARATSRWLAEIGYAVGKYAWGTVFAEIDRKAGDGGGGVRFK